MPRTPPCAPNAVINALFPEQVDHVIDLTEVLHDLNAQYIEHIFCYPWREPVVGPPALFSVVRHDGTNVVTAAGNDVARSKTTDVIEVARHNGALLKRSNGQLVKRSEAP